MAEPVSIISGVSGLLKALAATTVYLNGTANASREAQEIANHVRATEAILKSLKASLRTLHRSAEFYNIWSDSTNLVLSNVKATIDDLNSKLGSRGGTLRLSFWTRVQWPLAREDTLMLQRQMQAYMQMLSIVQNAFMQGNVLTVRTSARNIDDILTEIGTLTSTLSRQSAYQTSVVGSVSSEATIIPSDSVSEVRREGTRNSVPTNTGPRQSWGRLLSVRRSNSTRPNIPTQQLDLAQNPDPGQ